FFFQLYLFKQTFTRDLQALAEVIAANCSGPVSFHDKEAAEEVLGTLKSRRQIVAAGLYLPDGTPWVHFGAQDDAAWAGGSLSAGQVRFFHRDCYLSHPIRLQGELLGSLRLRANFDATYRGLVAFYAATLAAVLGGSFLV